MNWTVSLEKGAFTLRPDPLPPGMAELAFVGRTPGGEPYPLPGSLAHLDQVHGTRVAAAQEPGPIAETDGVFTRTGSLTLLVRTADCLPVILSAPGVGLAAVHAGWRGAAEGIVGRALAHFRDADEVHAVIGPGIGSCCFEVGPEVAGRFPGAVRTRPGARPHVDLAAAVRRDLTGFSPGRMVIDPPGPCTRCHQHILHSHRGSRGGPGRILALARLA